MRWLAAILVAAVVVAAAVWWYRPPGGVSVPVPGAGAAPDGGAAAPAATGAVTTGSPTSAADVDEHDPLGLPTSRSRQLQVLHKAHFTVGYDNQRREPAWTSYHLAGPIQFHGHEQRPQRFAPDPAVQRAAQHEDYTGSGYDRGHLTPAFAMWSRFGDEAMRATFVTSNIVPQVHAMNAGVWEDIETLVAGRDGRGGGWAESCGEVWVTDGPVHVPSEPSLPAGEPVPSACFMIVLRHRGDGWSTLAFEVPNRAVERDPRRYLVAIDAIEGETGLDFAPTLPRDDRAALEHSAARDLW